MAVESTDGFKNQSTVEIKIPPPPPLDFIKFAHVRLEQIKSSFEECAAQFKEVSEQLSSLQTKKDARIEEIKNNQNENNYLKELEATWEAKKDAVPKPNLKNISQNVKNALAVEGFSIKEINCSENNKLRQYKLELKENYYIMLQHDENSRFQLMQICPEHKNFEAIKQFLYDTQDVQCFLYTISKFFNLEQSESKM